MLKKKRNKTQCKDVTLHSTDTSKAKIETLCVIEPNVQMPNDGDSERQRQLIANKHSQRHKHTPTLTHPPTAQLQIILHTEREREISATKLLLIRKIYLSIITM